MPKAKREPPRNPNPRLKPPRENPFPPRNPPPPNPRENPLPPREKPPPRENPAPPPPRENPPPPPRENPPPPWDPPRCANAAVTKRHKMPTPRSFMRSLSYPEAYRRSYRCARAQSFMG